MEDESTERRSKRPKRESSYKAKAFEKFRDAKSGRKNKYEVEEVDNVYDTIDEREYTKKVLQRQDDDWIVDDDGSGYVEDGRDIFDDDLDHQSIAAASSSKSKGVKRKKRVAENAGKGNVQFLLSNMPAKKKEEKKLDEDDTLAELLQEINDNTAATTKVTNFSSLSAKQAEKDYVNSLKRPSVEVESTQLKKIINREASTVQQANTEVFIPFKKNVALVKQPEPEENQSNKSLVDSIIDSSQIDESQQHEDCFNDDLDMSLVEEVEEPQPVSKIENLNYEMLKDWAQNEICEDAPNLDYSVSEIQDTNAFKFFWWDAFEDSARQPGIVFLFGKTFHEKSNSYVSCCVPVRNIERRIFFLPRVKEKNSDNLVTIRDVYNEVNQLMKHMNIKFFKSRPVTKKYAFHPEIPSESEYVEVRFSARDPPVAPTTEGCTFSKVFGTESSYLEILLLDRKIKGPCWLEIADPEPVTNPISWCKVEINCNKVADISIVKGTDRPPLVVTAINMRRTLNPKTGNNEVVMLSCVTNTCYSVDRQAPTQNFFQKHFCVFTTPRSQILPMDLHNTMKNFTFTTLQKMHSEKALLNYFIAQLASLDPDLIVGHDLQGYQMNVLSERLAFHKNTLFSKLGRIKRTVLLKPKLEKEMFVGRLVCDVKISAKELIKSRSYELDALCQAVLKVDDNQRVDLEPDDVAKMFQTTNDLLKLVCLTMYDAGYILRILYSLNIVPLALQITNIAGNVMSKTLLGGRSERNEFLLLHAFSEKGYIVPDKIYGKRQLSDKKGSRKKPTYSGGLVLEPKVGFYDKLILLMDFNSLYPSIIQEYNICFTTMSPELSEDNMLLPDKSLPAGILPTEIRKLVESRRQVKGLMANPDLSPDEKMQYHIRQMALKLTANSMYGCLGFSNSRFYARNLAALVTYKGREILTDTKDIVQRMNFEVIYGDTDSLMINTNIVDYDQVFAIGSKIKQEINKLYKQVELDIDGVFKYLLLLKKKKYAAVILSKDKNGALKSELEYKGLDIVRRDWSKLAAEAGKFVLNEILSEQNSDDRVSKVLGYLRQIKLDLENDRVPISLLIITKQLTKNPDLYVDANSQPHVQVALRYNKESGGHFRAGDTVPYVICEDGSDKAPTQRVYHVEELKNPNLKIDVKYYLGMQIHPVVSRICEPIEEMDAFQIAECLGVDSTNLKRALKAGGFDSENITKPEIKFRDVEAFAFNCLGCKSEIRLNKPSLLEKCGNSQCKVRPVEYVEQIQNKLMQKINSYVHKYYSYELRCSDETCGSVTRIMPLRFEGRFPRCTVCHYSVLQKTYTEKALFSQLSFFRYIFDLSKWNKRPLMDHQTEKALNDTKDLIDNILESCGYCTVDLSKMFNMFRPLRRENNDDYDLVEFADNFEENDYLDVEE